MDGLSGEGKGNGGWGCHGGRGGGGKSEKEGLGCLDADSDGLEGSMGAFCGRIGDMGEVDAIVGERGEGMR